MKGKDLVEKINKELETETETVVVEIIKSRLKELRRIKKLLQIAESDYKDLLEMDIEDIVDNDDFDY